MTEVLRAIASHSEVATDGVIRGVASSIGNVDRAKRCFLPGAFGSSNFKVPLLAYHDDQRPVGSSSMIPAGSTLRHETKLANIASAADMLELIRAGAIPATSIGWISHVDYYGWKALEKADPQLASLAANHGIQPREDVMYFAKVEVVENSLVPVPANPLALISAASLTLPGSVDRALLDGMIEMAKGSRHSQNDQADIQTAHDSMVRLGAVCAACQEENDTHPGAKLFDMEVVAAPKTETAESAVTETETGAAETETAESDDAAVPSLEVQLAALDPDLAQLESELNHITSGH